MRAEPTRDELVRAIDLLWGFMPSEQVNEIRVDERWLYDLCQRNHHDLWHGTTHEERMMRGLQ